MNYINKVNFWQNNLLILLVKQLISVEQRQQLNDRVHKYKTTTCQIQGNYRLSDIYLNGARRLLLQRSLTGDELRPTNSD